MREDAGTRAARAAVVVRPLQNADRPWAAEVLAARWGAAVVVSPAGVRDASTLSGFVAEWAEGEGEGPANERLGLVTYDIVGSGCEVVTLDSLVPRRGVGTALLDAVRRKAMRTGCRWLWLSTTNDNTPALRFYQRRGWELVALHRNAVTEWRRVKPQIPERGVDDIPLRHALVLELPIEPLDAEDEEREDAPREDVPREDAPREDAGPGATGHGA